MVRTILNKKGNKVRDVFILRGDKNYINDQYNERDARAVLRALTLSTQGMSAKLKFMKVTLVWDLDAK